MNEHLQQIQDWFTSLPLEHQYALAGGLAGGGAGALGGLATGGKRRGSGALIGGALGGLGGAGIGYGLSRLAPPAAELATAGPAAAIASPAAGPATTSKLETTPVSTAEASAAPTAGYESGIGRELRHGLGGAGLAAAVPSARQSLKNLAAPIPTPSRPPGAATPHWRTPAPGRRFALQGVRPSKLTVLGGLLGGVTAAHGDVVSDAAQAAAEAAR